MEKFFIPRSIEDLVALQARNEVEGPWLEYKSARILEQKNDKIFEALSKELSAFANSDGGVLIIGAEENNDRSISKFEPVRDSSKTDSWLEDGILPRVHPKVRLSIASIQYDGGTIFVIEVPASFSGPHQASDRRFYARRLFRVDPLLPFEIDDIRRRKPNSGPSLSIEMKSDFGSIGFTIVNTGSQPLFDLHFKIDGIDNLEIAKQWNPGLQRPYTAPFMMLNAGDTRHFPSAGYEFFSERLGDRMDVSVRYRDVAGGSHISQVTYYLKDLETTVREKTPIEEIGKSLISQLEIMAK